MPPSNKAVTLRDLQATLENARPKSGGIPSTQDNATILSDQGSSQRDPGLHEIFHIPTLPNAEQARQMLERVVNEFRPIAKRRGYMVLSVSELCCCNDGLDFRNEGKRRKLRKVSNNIWGYNRTMWRTGRRKVHTIHIRLRHAQNHNRFLPYEDVAGTLAHELSHCEHGPHDEKFYKLMDSILEEHASLMASNGSFWGLSNNTQSSQPNFTPFSGQGRKLGSNDGGSSGKETAKSLGRGYTLGGDASFTQWMTPREAAVAAALARQRQQYLRLRGNRCCRPCVISGEDDDDEVQIIDVRPSNSSHSKHKQVKATQRKRPPGTENLQPSKRSQSGNEGVVDLTGGDNTTIKLSTAVGSWNCQACTFLNQSVSACEMCLAPRPRQP